jgi:sarcosine oxidase
VLDAAAIRSRFPALAPERDMLGVLEPRAGVLFPERCIAALLEDAAGAGAALHMDEPLHGWEADGDGVRVFTSRAEYQARRLIATAGAWVGSLFPELALRFDIERQALFWFRARMEPKRFDPASCPIHLWQFDGGEFFYGFPDMGGGIKAARHHHGRSFSTPDGVDRTVTAAEIEDVRALVRRFVPCADGALERTAVCLYTNTPDEHFWIDGHATHRQVLIVSPCSGHGSKFAPAIGEIVADLADGVRPRLDVSMFAARAA